MINLFKREYSKLFFIGLASSLAFAPTYLFFIFFFSFCYLLEKLECEKSIKFSYKKNFFLGWWFGFGYFIGNCYWYCSSLLIEPLKFGWLIPFAITIIPAYLAIYIALTVIFTKIFSDYVKNKFLVTVAFAFFWTIFEYLRGIIFTGFPWNLIGYSLGFSPILFQMVSIFGSYTFGFIIIILYGGLYVLKNREYKYYSIIYIVILTVIFSFGFYKLYIKNIHNNIQNIRLVQPCISQEEKINSREEDILEKLLDLSLQDSENINYIIWPEASLPYFLLLEEQYDKKVLDILKDKLGEKILITGGIRIDRKEGKIFNSIFIIKNGKILDFYDKYHLVPFGEYIPFSSVFKFLSTITGTVNISPSNTRKKLIDLENFPEFSPNICYESIFPSSINEKAELIINLTNDAWFGRTSGPHQHLVASQFRAVENSVPVIRVANSGITAFIDKNGRILKKMKLGKIGVVDLF